MAKPAAKNHSELTVHLRHEEDGQLYTFRPGDPLPDWALKRIDNPYVRGTAVPDPKGASLVHAPHRAVGALPKRAEEESDEDGDSDGDESRPPENGPAASRERWAAYARTHKIEVRDAWKREDIIAACNERGV
jgi:hypothetical protein